MAISIIIDDHCVIIEQSVYIDEPAGRTVV